MIILCLNSLDPDQAQPNIEGEIQYNPVTHLSIKLGGQF